MAGTLTISTLSDGTNSTSATNCISGSAKAWINYNGSGASIRASYNVTSVTVLGTGNYQINFTNAFSDTNYVSVITTTETYSSGNYDLIGTNNQATSYCQMYAKNGAGTTYTPFQVNAIFFR